MYARSIRCKNQKQNLVFQPAKTSARSNCQEHVCYRSLSRRLISGVYPSQASLIRRYLFSLCSSRCFADGNSSASLHPRSITCLKSSLLRVYSSEGDERNASEDKQPPLNDEAKLDKGKTCNEKVGVNVKLSDCHDQLGEQDQLEWLNNEKIATESRKKESPFFTRREKFKSEFLRRVVPWENITVTWESFPYFIHEHSKNLLVECVSSHLKHKKYAAYGAHLISSRARILLQSVPGTELYRERLIRALARNLQVPLLVLDSNILAPYDFGDDCLSDDETAESGEDCTSDSEIEDENDACNKEESASTEAKSVSSDDDVVDVKETAEAALDKLVHYNERVSGECDGRSGLSKCDAAEISDISRKPLRKGDRVKYIGPSLTVEADDRPLSSGQCGEIYEVNVDQAAVILDIRQNKLKEGAKGDPPTNQSGRPPVYWIPVQDIVHNYDKEAEDCYIAVEALSEVLNSMQPIIVYFPDSSQWLSRAVPKSGLKEFVSKVQEIFDKLSSPVILICGKNKVESGSKEKEKLTTVLPNFDRLANLPLHLKRLADGLKETKRSMDNEISKLFTNVLCIHPPKEEDQLKTFNKQIEEDRRIITSRSNIHELHEVLEENELSCLDLLHVNTNGVILTKQKAETVVGWAKNHYLSSCLIPSIKGERLYLPRESLETALLRLRQQETSTQKISSLKDLTKDEYESNFVSAVVSSSEIDIRFDDIGVLEDVKKALDELVILPMSRPELFSRGNLLRPCKGILLFGPPGTGKTLLAKALATEAGANFISITGSTLTSKWFGDAEKLTKALFSFASKLSPVIIFIDEIDSLLGARGGASEHEASRRMRNEFMAAWDGLRTKEGQKILILGATNRPFDLDDAIIRRLPRRIYVDLPDAENRSRILSIFLAKENLEKDFQFDKLANATEGYSGSDLKNLCIAAAYRPVQELIEEEKKGAKNCSTSELRPLNLDDFIQSKSKVSPSVAFDAASMNELRKWNEQYGEGGSRRKSPFGFGN